MLSPFFWMYAIIGNEVPESPEVPCVTTSCGELSIMLNLISYIKVCRN